MKPIKSAKRAEDYYSLTDGGYYHDGSGLRSKWGGLGADMLGLDTLLTPEHEHFKNLVNGLDPFTGEQLTARLRDDRIPAWDLTGSVPKGVTEAAEGGDERVPPAMWRAVERTMKRVEQYATTRVRVGGSQDDRVTGNLVWYAIEHPDTRPVEDENLPAGHRWKVMPDPDRHIHVVPMNLTWDDVERRWKAVKFRPIMDLRKFFDRTFDAEMAAEMADLGYEIERFYKPDGKGNLRFFSWDIKGIPDSLKRKDSRRSQEVDELEAEIVAAKKAEDEYAPDRLSAVARDKLGATSRRTKRDDLTLAECREYWDSRRTDDERASVAETIRRARLGLNPKPGKLAAYAADFAMRHHFELESAVPLEKLVTTALEQSIGHARPADIERELTRQGVIVIEREGKKLATTAALMWEEEFLAGLSMEGQGMAVPVGVAKGLSRQLATGETLNGGQWDAATGLLESGNRFNLVLGPAGAGKSKMLRKFDEGMRRAGKHATYLGTTAASVKVLKRDGFKDTQTVARFLLDEKLQKEAAGGRVVIDETSILGHADAVKLFAVAKKHDLKLIFVGDPMQHGSIGRGNVLRLLEKFGHLKPFRLTEILRQKDPAYRAAAQLLSEGKAAEGFKALDDLGFVQELENGKDRYSHMAADYVRALADGVAWDDLLVVAPTHREAGFITQEIRSQLRQAGRLGTEERRFTRLVPIEVSEAQRGLASTYRNGDILQFHQNAKGGFVKGRRYVVADPANVPLSEAGKFTVFRQADISLAVGDVIRFTGTVKPVGRTDTLRNGDAHAVAGFTDAGHLRLDNGWVISGKEALPYRSGFVETSIGSQGRTVRRVLLGMSAAAGRMAINMQQLYVSASRSSETMRLYTDDKQEIADAAQRDSRKLLALDLKETSDAALHVKAEREKRRLDDLFRRQSMAAYRWMLSERRRLSTRDIILPPTPPRTPTPGHAGRLRERHAERGGHGR